MNIPCKDHPIGAILTRGGRRRSPEPPIAICPFGRESAGSSPRAVRQRSERPSGGTGHRGANPPRAEKTLPGNRFFRLVHTKRSAMRKEHGIRFSHQAQRGGKPVYAVCGCVDVHQKGPQTRTSRKNLLPAARFAAESPSAASVGIHVDNIYVKVYVNVI